MALTLHVCPGDSSAVVWASGDVDTNVAETFRDMMLSVMRRHSPSLLLDLSGVSFMDCAGLRALLLTQQRAGMRGGSVSLIAESPAVRRIIDLLGVRDVLPGSRAARRAQRRPARPARRSRTAPLPVRRAARGVPAGPAAGR